MRLVSLSIIHVHATNHKHYMTVVIKSSCTHPLLTPAHVSHVSVPMHRKHVHGITYSTSFCIVSESHTACMYKPCWCYVNWLRIIMHLHLQFLPRSPVATTIVPYQTMSHAWTAVILVHTCIQSHPIFSMCTAYCCTCISSANTGNNYWNFWKRKF